MEWFSGFSAGLNPIGHFLSGDVSGSKGKKLQGLENDSNTASFFVLDWKFGALGNRMRAVTYSISLKPAVLILILKLHTVLLQPENPSIRKINGKYFLCDFRIKNALQNMLINTNNIMKFLTSCTPIQFNSNSNNCY